MSSSPHCAFRKCGPSSVYWLLKVWSPGPAESSGNLLEMQIPGLNPKPSESETQVVGTNNQAFHVTFMHATV